jgi:Flp pilus assembly protein TadG
MKRTPHQIARFASDASGAAAVEFAIVSGVFILMIFGIIYMGIILHTNATLQWAVENSVRAAVITESTTQAQMTTKVNGFLSQMNMPNADNVSYAVAGTTPKIATLTADLTRTYTIPMLGSYTISYTATAKMPQSGT